MSIKIPDLITHKDKYYCYIIKSVNPKYSSHTYNGSTNNLTRRLRQHNGEICGGAKATRGKGPWEYIVIWDGFETYNECLSCEWRIKHPTNSKKRPHIYNGINGRIKSLNILVNLDCWTNKSSGMGYNNKNQYNLYIRSELSNLLNFPDKKTNLDIITFD